MKKNKFMRLASALLVLTLLSTCAISGTFAKYVTTSTATQTTRVAKWGVVMTAGGSLYSDEYLKGTNTPNFDVNATGDTLSVSCVDTEGNIVAPGTKNDTGFHFSITGKPEVSTQITGTVSAKDIYLAAGEYAVMTKVTVKNADDFDSYGTEKLYTYDSNAKTYSKATSYTAEDNDGNDIVYYLITDDVAVAEAYYPIVYTLQQKGNETYNTELAKYTKLSEIAAGLVWTLTNGANDVAYTADGEMIASVTGNAAAYKWTIADGANTFDPNTDFSTQPPITGSSTTHLAKGLSNFTITWKWAFEKDVEAEGDDPAPENITDGADTILGHLIAAATATAGENDTTVKVVYKATTNDSSYADVTFGKEDSSLVKCGETQVAYLTTEFSFNLTISQVD